MITCWGENITEQWHVSYYVGTPDSMAAGGGGRGGGGEQEGFCQEEGNTSTLLQCMWAHLTKQQGRGRGGGGGRGEEGKGGEQGEGEGKGEGGEEGEGEGEGEGGEEGEGEGEGEGRVTRGSQSGIMHLWRRRRTHALLWRGGGAEGEGGYCRTYLYTTYMGTYM